MNVIKRVGKLSLIDLAGSERAVATDQRTLRSLEGANINRSLLALSSCINALVEGKKHIPYRNSKLTQLLKDSLGGACNTVMIANISPSNLSFGETQNTLHWADRAKEIRNKVYTIHLIVYPITFYPFFIVSKLSKFSRSYLPSMSWKVQSGGNGE